MNKSRQYAIVHSMPSQTPKESSEQLRKFKDLARELECDDDQAASTNGLSDLPRLQSPRRLLISSEESDAQTRHLFGKFGLWVSILALAVERLWFHSGEVFWVILLTVLISTGSIPARPRPQLD